MTHVHGSADVGDESDGYAEAWFLPGGQATSRRLCRPRHLVRLLPAQGCTQGVGGSPSGTTWEPGTAVFQYPNTQRASTIWYHDHTLGMTRLNVYAGPAGFFIVRGGPAGDGAVLDSRTGKPAVLPGPAPSEGDKFPANKTYYEIPIAIQDRSFNSRWLAVLSRQRVHSLTASPGPYIPDTDISPIWNPEFFGNMIMVNGNTWPFLDVEKRRYRLRFLNGCDARVPDSRLQRASQASRSG